MELTYPYGHIGFFHRTQNPRASEAIYRGFLKNSMYNELRGQSCNGVPILYSTKTSHSSPEIPLENADEWWIRIDQIVEKSFSSKKITQTHIEIPPHKKKYPTTEMIRKVYWDYIFGGLLTVPQLLGKIAPKTVKTKGLGNLKTRWFTIKN